MDLQTQPAPPQPPPSTAPPISAPVAVSPTSAAAGYPDSTDSSPRSRSSFYDEQQQHQQKPSQSSKLRLMCSYGGRIVPRPHDKSLCYVGGDTRIVVVDRNSSLSGLSSKLSTTLLNGRPFTLKYQLPSEDLDSLISVTTDEDLDNMIDEYDRTITSTGGVCGGSNSAKPSRLRLFLFPVVKPDSSQSIGAILENSAAKDEWFLSALNGAAAAGLLNRGFSDSASVNCLLGLDDDPNVHPSYVGIGGGNGDGNGNGGGGVRDGEGLNQNAKPGQDFHSVPDSPMMMETTTSSFGSTSSSPSLANLPPIRVHVAQEQQKAGMEEQFAQISLGGGVQKPDEGLMPISSPPPMPVPITDDDRSDQGVPVVYRRPLTAQSQLQMPPPQTQQQKSNSGGGGGGDIASPDSVSSDSSFSNGMNRQKQPGISQEQVMQVPPGANRVVSVTPNLVAPNSRVQVQDSGNLLPPQFEHHHQQQQQFVQAGAQYIQHHPSGGVPMQTYYPVYTHQQQQQQQHPHQMDQQYPVYYVQTRHPPAYTMPVQMHQSSAPEHAKNIPSSPSQPPPVSTPVPKPEILPTGMYRTTNAVGTPQLVTLSSGQLHHHQQQQQQHQQHQQFVGYSQVQHHPSQSVAPPGNPNYGYEFVDPSHGQLYYTQPPMPSQYQTMTSGAVLSEGSAQLPTDPIKRTS